VVNIDNGFGAAMLAGQILRTAQRLSNSNQWSQKVLLEKIPVILTRTDLKIIVLNL
jgi:hypothetical protein